MNTRLRAQSFGRLPGPRGLSRARTTRRFFGRPYLALGGMHEEIGDLAAINIFGMHFVSLRDPAWIDQMLRDADGVFIKDKVLRDLTALLGHGLLTSENPLWMQQRRRIAPAFTRKHIQSYALTMRELTRAMLSGWRDGQHMDLHAAWMSVTLKIVVQTLFDAEVGPAEHAISSALDRALEHFDRELNTPMGLLPQWIPTRTRADFRRSVVEMDGVIFRLIEERRRRGDVGHDLLGRMMFARDDSGASMSDRQLRDEAITLVLAGHETTALTMTWTAMLLSKHPEVARKLRQELAEQMQDADDLSVFGVDMATRLPYTVAVLRESMRLCPPAWIVGRELTADVQFGPHTVPAGTQVMACIWVMHRDARYFDRPEEFRPERWLDGLHERLPRGVYMPFGGGARVCIGNHFAMMEAAILLTELVRAWDFRVDAGYEPDLVASITLRPRHGMPGVVTRV